MDFVFLVEAAAANHAPADAGRESGGEPPEGTAGTNEDICPACKGRGKVVPRRRLCELR